MCAYACLCMCMYVCVSVSMPVYFFSMLYTWMDGNKGQVVTSITSSLITCYIPYLRVYSKKRSKLPHICQSTFEPINHSFNQSISISFYLSTSKYIKQSISLYHSPDRVRREVGAARVLAAGVWLPLALVDILTAILPPPGPIESRVTITGERSNTAAAVVLEVGLVAW